MEQSTVKQKIAEYPTTDWEGITVRTTLSHPKFPHTITAQTIFDRRMMDEIIYLIPPKDIEFLRMPEKIFEYQVWEKHNRRARTLIEHIAKDIANHLLRILAEGLNKCHT